MAGDSEEPWPSEGELLVCTVKSVRENGAYLNLDGYGEREGFVFIGEVAAGWVRSIRNHLRVGQRVVAKVIGVRRDRAAQGYAAILEERDARYADYEGRSRARRLG